MMIVGLTGGIGSGKSTVARFFETLGVPVYNSDKEARMLMRSSKKVKQAIVDLLGADAYQDNRLNKPYISEQIFNNKDLLEKLNAIVHPAVREHFLQWVNQQNAAYVIQETALIFENEMQDFYDKVILVTAPKTLRIERVSRRDDLKPEVIITRMNNQLTDAEKIPLTNFIIENIELSKTKKEVAKLHKILLTYC